MVDSKKSDKYWREKLTPEQYHITREKRTEPPFSGLYVDNKDRGMYKCIACGMSLFSSDTKFDSGTGWPSFTNPTDSKNIKLTTDYSHGIVREEASCANCGAHLGHVFDDGPTDQGGQRYCINSCALNFEKKKDEK